MARRDEEKPVDVVEDALGLVRHAETGDPTVRPDVPSAEPSTSEGSRLATDLAPLARAVPPVPPTDRLKSRILASVSATTPLAGLTDRLQRLTGLDGAGVEELLRAAADPRGEGWTDGPAPGIRWYLFRAGPSRDRAPSALVYCDPGTVFPEHDHTGAEWALILDGAAEDSGGGRWSLGDEISYEAGTRHWFRTTSRPLLAAVVAERGVVLPGQKS